MFIKAKQSGELLTKKNSGELWTPDGVVNSTEKISRAYKQKDRLSLDGLMIVSGAGNIIRGDKLKEHGLAQGVEDVLGRLATIQNTLVLASSLSAAKVPNKVFIANNMGFSDPAIGKIDPYNIEAEREAYSREEVVLIAGGTGEDGKTTDNAVLEYARRHAERWPEDEVVVIKGTKYDGVYTGDPEKNANVRRYASISAKYMLDNYERYPVVDRACLESIIDTGLSMRVYQDGSHDLEAALAINGSSIGTLIVPENKEAVLA